MTARLGNIKDLTKGFGIDVASILAFFATWLPVLQGIIGFFIAVVILLINCSRYKKIKRSNNESRQEKKEKN